MNENRISIEITDAQKTDITEKINELIVLLQPIVIALDKTDKKRLAKISDDAIPFVEKVEQYAVSNPEFIPPFTSFDEFKKDFKAFTILREFVRPLMQVVSNLEDTWALTGSEADDFARLYYAMVAQGAKMGVSGAQAIYDDLKPRFDTQRLKPKKPATTPNTQPTI